MLIIMMIVKSETFDKICNLKFIAEWFDIVITQITIWLTANFDLL